LKKHQVPCEHAASTAHFIVQELTVLKELNKGIKVSGSSVGIELQGCHHLGAQVWPVDGFKNLCHCKIVVVQPQVPALHACNTLTCHVGIQIQTLSGVSTISKNNCLQGWLATALIALWEQHLLFSHPVSSGTSVMTMRPGCTVTYNTWLLFQAPCNCRSLGRQPKQCWRHL